MEGEWKEQFTAEELQSMGEEAAPGKPEPKPETPENEPKPEPSPEPEPGGEPKGEPEPEPEPTEGEPVPYDRFAKVYGRAKQTEREREEYKEKLDLFKRDQAAYYEKYPDEKPADYQSEKPIATEILPMRKMLSAAIHDPENPEYHGKTLEELLDMGSEGIAAANDYYREYVEDIQGQVKAHMERESEAVKTLREEDNRFIDSRSQELFGKPAKNLDTVQQDRVEKVVSDTLAWMKTNGRMAYKLEDAFRLMNYEKTIADATTKGAKSLTDFAKSGNVKSVSAGGSKPSSDPYSAYLEMSEADISAKVLNMGDAEFTKFLKEATPAFRQKFPDLPYLN